MWMDGKYNRLLIIERQVKRRRAISAVCVRHSLSSNGPPLNRVFTYRTKTTMKEEKYAGDHILSI